MLRLEKTARKQAARRNEPPAKESLLKERAYSELKIRIQDGHFLPGVFLSERQLAGLLGMSKTPVKAALERLESEGFISVSPQRGIMLRELTVHEVADHFEIREVLETFVLRSIAGRIQPEQAKRLRANLDATREAAEARNVTCSIELDAEFHVLFGEFLGNQEIVRVMHQLREKIHRVVSFVSRREPDRLTASYQEHARIAEAVLDGNGERASQLLVEHLAFGKQLLLSPRIQRA
jgi:DNA-binding GntR family transcriptional regulator